MNDTELESAAKFAGHDLTTHHDTQSPQINELATALAKAQGEITGASKERTNPFFKSSYADLTSVWDACREALSKNGLAVIQTTACTNGAVTLITTLAHSSGQWIRGTWPIKPVKEDLQGYVSAVTYGRRVCLASMVGVAPRSDDDDAEGASGRKATSAYPNTDQGASTTRETGRDLWGGPLKKQAFQKALHEFNGDMAACEDYDTLLGLLNSDETVELVTQCERDRPSWWYGTGGDVEGLKDRIEARKADFEAVEQPPVDA